MCPSERLAASALCYRTDFPQTDVTSPFRQKMKYAYALIHVPVNSPRIWIFRYLGTSRFNTMMMIKPVWGPRAGIMFKFWMDFLEKA